MDELEIVLNNETLCISKKRARIIDGNKVYIDLNNLETDKVYKYKLKGLKEFQQNKVLLFQRGIIRKVIDKNNYEELERYIAVYTTKKDVKYICASSIETVYKKLVKLKYKVLNISLSKRRVKFKVLAYIVNKYDLPISEVNFQIGDCLKRECNLQQYPEKISKIKMLLKRMIYNYRFKMDEILEDESFINAPVKYTINIDDLCVDYQIAKRKKHIKHKKDYYIPMMSKYTKNHAIHIRRTMMGNLIFVKRLMEPIENTLKFRVLESKLMSRSLYYISKLRIFGKKINLYYEKFSEKAEEGTYELCKMAQKSKKSKNYFIIDENSIYYNKIKKSKFVVRKYSFKYYWLIYNANTFIATETQMHSNILRSNNKYLRKNINKKNYVFLQHGIIFMKNLGKNSTFIKGREAEPQYMVVSSEYEKEVVMDMLDLPEERLLKTGLALYSKLDYKHINIDSEDYITIMLTWKPYEEYLVDFKESSYYQNVMDLYNVLSKYINKEKIRIVAHPKVNELLESTDLKQILWNESIFDCLQSTKLLITDYSSVCYNAFYQGAAVLFYQPDLEFYEEQNGKLIPNDDEYIGYRAFSIEEMEEIIKATIINKKIDLNILRNKKFENMYSKINEFSDGKNLERIFGKLKEVEIV